MTDDSSHQNPRPRPELPLPGPQVPPPPLAPVQAGGAARWRWPQAVLAFFGGFAVSQIIVLLLAVIWGAFAAKGLDALSDDSTFVLVASALNEGVFIVAAWLVARMTGPTAAGDFGLLRARVWPTLWRMGVVMAGYLVLLAIYSALVKLAPDSAPDRLGATRSDLHMIGFVLMVGALAPFAEEFFFRGLIYRALRNSIGIVAAALVSGLLFGAMHIDSGSSERLLQVVPLAVLGISFALLYEWTGTLYSTIALHATNNALAVVAYADKNNSSLGIALAAVVWLAMMVFCLLAPRLTDRPPAAQVEYP